MSEISKKAALDYHELPVPGKLGTYISKPLETQRDFALAYTPGVAEPVRAIHDHPENAYRYTAKGNLVAVITDGTAVLGLGNVGPLASKPVMEGKAILYKALAGIDSFDIEVETTSSADFINTVVRISPTFGGINLEDIKAPQCFEIEQALKERLDIPVFHDDQHGTAIIVAAGLLNALELQKKSIEKVKIVCLGAGAAGIATMKLLISLGARKDNIYMIDRKGVIHTHREDLNPYKFALANETDKRTLDEAMDGADVFVGVSGPGLVAPHLIDTLAKNPIVFALSNPDPEIDPAMALARRDDLIMATGRPDYPNQVNNVLCFPFIFRGTLDVRAKHINQAMMIAAVHSIRDLAKEPVPESVLKVYPSMQGVSFGPLYILPKPNDPRLIDVVPKAVSQAAIDTGVAQTSK